MAQGTHLTVDGYTSVHHKHDNHVTLTGTLPQEMETER